MTADRLKRWLLLGWSAWWTVVLATNVCDALKELGLLSPEWQFASGNYQFISATTARYGVADWLNGLLFAGAIGWEGCAAVLFWLVWWDGRGRAVSQSRFLYPAFGVGLMLWIGFMLADELCMAYAVEAAHVRIFTAQAVTLLVIVLLPGDTTMADV